MSKLRVSIGITAYNEEANIKNLLVSLLNQELNQVNISEIIVVASGCTDRTEEIVRELITNNPKIKLISQKTREGKASAINLFLKSAQSEICIIESADTIPAKNTIEKLIIPFFDSEIGMTGGHPIPVNDKNKFIGFAVNMLWDLHHKLSLISPKLGEMIAFRKIFDGIPDDTAVDEVSIEAIITKKGLKLKYIPEAIVHNKGPEKIKEFISQRRRIYTGHLWSKKFQNYSPSTMNSTRIIKLLFKQKKGTGYFFLIWTCCTVFLEVVSRLLGLWDFYIRHKNPFKWDIAKSSKNIK